MRTIVVTGSASGIGAAIRGALEADGARVIGVDLRAAEVTADLATAAGRAAMVTGVEGACGGRLDGVVACAGVGPHVGDPALIVSVNYFGARASLAELRPALARGERPAAVAISSNSSTMPNAEGPLVDACLAGDEEAARRVAATIDPVSAYAGAKRALTRWLRHQAPGADWAGAGIRLNAVAAGAVRTPLLEGGLADPVLGRAIEAFPIPLGGYAKPEEIAATVGFLLGPDASFCCGSVLFVDGGTDALLRPDQY